jgi:hypothetical protein
LGRNSRFGLTGQTPKVENEFWVGTWDGPAFATAIFIYSTSRRFLDHNEVEDLYNTLYQSQNISGDIRTCDKYKKIMSLQHAKVKQPGEAEHT